MPFLVSFVRFPPCIFVGLAHQVLSQAQRWLCIYLRGGCRESVLQVTAAPVCCFHAFGPLDAPLMPNALAAMSSFGPYPLKGAV